MTTTLGFALLLTAAHSSTRRLFSLPSARPHKTPQSPYTGDATRPRHWSLPVLLGAVIGTLVTFTSVGAGAIGVTGAAAGLPLLPLPRIIGADIAYAVPLTLVAGWAMPRSARWTGLCLHNCWLARCPASGWARAWSPAP